MHPRPLHVSLSLAALAALAALATPASAQEQQGAAAAQRLGAPTRTSIGPVIGANYTTFYGSDADGSSSHMGYLAGGQLDHDFGAGGTFRVGLLYSQRGAEESDQGVTATFKLNYLELPVMLGYRFGSGSSSVRPYLMAGTHLAIKVGCSVEATDGSATFSESCSGDDFNGTKFSSTDVAGVVGGGLAFPMGTRSVDVHLGYSMGLVKIAENAQMKNRGFTFRVGYMIPLGQ